MDFIIPISAVTITAGSLIFSVFMIRRNGRDKVSLSMREEIKELRQENKRLTSENVELLRRLVFDEE